MSGAHVVGFGAVSALGSGIEAFCVGNLGDRARVAIERDAFFESQGLLRPHAARVSCVARGGRDRATELLSAALRQCIDRLDPACLKKRVGLAIGTSSGGMLAMERFFSTVARGERITRPVARAATYFAPLEDAVADTGVAFSPRVLVLGACASSTIAIGLAMRWLALGRCDIALAGGFDALSSFVASGFEVLRATTASRPRPFRADRDGMALGEGAAVVALARDSALAREAPLGFIAGFAASTDAVHLTAPDRSGHALGKAGARAIADAGISPAEIDLVSAHATATPFNDPAEARALRSAFGEHAPKLVHPFKAQIGHTLGAAGVLEVLSALDAMKRNIGPAAAGEGGIDPECAVPLGERNVELRSRAALKLSSAFGGANAALVLTPRSAPPQPIRAREVFLQRTSKVSEPPDLSVVVRSLQGRHPHAHRLDALAILVISAVERLLASQAISSAGDTGLVVGYTIATLEANELFDARRRELGVRAVEPRRFPATSPNAAAGECAIAFHLNGPTFAVGGSLHGGLEALAVARDLVAAGDASSMLVVAADLGGRVSSAWLAAAGVSQLGMGACACLLVSQPQEGDVALEAPIPPTLADGADWAWAPPFGHRELGAYLDRLGAR
jgi:3-oxoacyl-[acyl-carrier-protein] synthase-1/3-oxoacyl-[acyl-carrier-protein] synthase II